MRKRPPRFAGYGVALDIGTTDIKASLLDLRSKRELARANAPNEQKAFGRDVITRLYFAGKEKGLDELNRRVISVVNRLINGLAKGASLDPRQIEEIVAVGNSVMYHLTLKIDPQSLARAPFLPAESGLKTMNAGRMGLSAREAAFTFLPNISGFVGSDALASILASGIYKDSRFNIIMDIGTNGEIVLGSSERIFVASCASGPAFEGGYIKYGMPAVEGAIIRAKAGKKGLSLKTVGGGAPRGIGGSGLIDLLSILLDKQIITASGRMSCKKFEICSTGARKIFIDQDDVRQAQLAKAALASGIEMLIRKANVEFDDIKSMYITGTFGLGIDKVNAKKIGLIPKMMPAGRIRFLKDGALSGAKKFLLEKPRRGDVEGILSKCVHVELHKEKDFESLFTSAMSF